MRLVELQKKSRFTARTCAQTYEAGVKGNVAFLAFSNDVSVLLFLYPVRVLVITISPLPKSASGFFCYNLQTLRFCEYPVH